MSRPATVLFLSIFIFFKLHSLNIDIYINYTRCKAEFFTLALAFYYAGIEKLDFSIYFCTPKDKNKV